MRIKGATVRLTGRKINPTSGEWTPSMVLNNWNPAEDADALLVRLRAAQEDQTKLQRRADYSEVDIVISYTTEEIVVLNEADVRLAQLLLLEGTLTVEPPWAGNS